MSHCHSHIHYYLEQRPTPEPPNFHLLPLVAILALLFLAALIDQMPINVLGPVLFPVEWVLNALFFPQAETHLRSNGSALLVIVPTGIVGAASYYAARTVLRAARRFHEAVKRAFALLSGRRS